MAFLVVLVVVVVAASASMIVARIRRRRLIDRIHDLGSLPEVHGLPGQASIDSGELGRGTAGGGVNQGGGLGGFT